MQLIKHPIQLGDAQVYLIAEKIVGTASLAIVAQKEKQLDTIPYQAAKACLKYGFYTLQFNKMVSFTSAINLNSEKVIKKIGMTKVGSFDHPKIAVTSILSKHVLY